jgi:ornithine cyclodeaminase/alanine dehydrogenase-like protein (mu-crystallin family)
MSLLIARLGVAFGGGDYHAPPRLTAAMSSTEALLVMPAWNASGKLGIKTVTTDSLARPSVRSSYLLSDRESGLPLALIDGAMLTRRRTAAASVLAASRLARPDSRSLLILGTGALVAPLIEAYTSAFRLDRIMIWGRDPAKARDAACEARDAGHRAEVALDISRAFGECDIVSAATMATSPLIRGAALLPGVHIDLIGAFRREMQEADGIAFARSRVFVDTIEGVCEEAGDLIAAIETGCLTVKDIEADLAELSSGSHPGRDGDASAITLFKSVGSAIEDLAAAELVFEAVP